MKLEKKTKAELIEIIEDLQAKAPEAEATEEPTADTVEWHFDQVEELIDNQLQGDELIEAEVAEEWYVRQGMKKYITPMELRHIAKEMDREKSYEYSSEDVQRWDVPPDRPIYQGVYKVAQTPPGFRKPY